MAKNKVALKWHAWALGFRFAGCGVGISLSLCFTDGIGGPRLNYYIILDGAIHQLGSQPGDGRHKRRRLKGREINYFLSDYIGRRCDRERDPAASGVHPGSLCGQSGPPTISSLTQTGESPGPLCPSPLSAHIRACMWTSPR